MMTVHMIDSHTGSNHISGQDMASLQSATLGDYAMRLAPTYWGNDVNNALGSVTSPPPASRFNGWGDRTNSMLFAIIDNNNVKVPAGQWLWCGRHVIIDSDTTVTISNGVQGQNRIDRICLHYAKSPNGVESCELVVVKGTPTAGNPSPTIGYCDYIGFGSTRYNAYMTICLVQVNDLVPSIMGDGYGFLPFLSSLRNVDYRLHSLETVNPSWLSVLRNPPTLSSALSNDSRDDQLDAEISVHPITGTLNMGAIDCMATVRIWWKAARLGAWQQAWYKHINLVRINGYHAPAASLGKAASNSIPEELPYSWFNIDSGKNVITWMPASGNFHHAAHDMWTTGSIDIPLVKD